MKKFLPVLGYILPFLSVPALVLAQTARLPLPVYGSSSGCAANNLVGIICKVHALLNSIIPVVVALGVVYFIWGVVQYVIAGGEEAKKQGRDRIIYGLIGFAVIISLWGLVKMLVVWLGVNGTDLVPQQAANTLTCTIATNPKLEDVLCYAARIINNSIIPLLFAVAGLYFVWGTIKFFIINAGEEAKREQGKQFMIWGIIAITVMLTVWGLVKIVAGTFGINASVLPQIVP